MLIKMQACKYDLTYIKQLSMDIKALHDKNNSNWDAYNVFLSLTEELGEFAKELNIATGSSYKEPSEDGVLGEAVDVILCILDYTTYASLHIDFDFEYVINYSENEKYDRDDFFDLVGEIGSIARYPSLANRLVPYITKLLVFLTSKYGAESVHDKIVLKSDKWKSKVEQQYS